MLRDMNRYEVLENYDDVEHAETGTKSTTGVNWEGKNLEINLIKTVKQPSCELSNTSSWNPTFPTDFLLLIAFLYFTFFHLGLYHIADSLSLIHSKAPSAMILHTLKHDCVFCFVSNELCHTKLYIS